MIEHIVPAYAKASADRPGANVLYFPNCSQVIFMSTGLQSSVKDFGVN